MHNFDDKHLIRQGPIILIFEPHALLQKEPYRPTFKEQSSIKKWYVLQIYQFYVSNYYCKLIKIYTVNLYSKSSPVKSIMK